MSKRALVLVAVGAVVVGGALASTGASSPSTASRVQDRCVVGEWRMSNSASTALLQSLIGSQFSVAEGVITAAFPRGDHMYYGSTHFVVKLATGPIVLKGSGSFAFDAGWQTSRGKLVLNAGRSTLTVDKMTGIKDGKTVTLPGPGTTNRRTSPGATPYTCSRNTLRWKIPVNDTWTLFRRVR